MGRSDDTDDPAVFTPEEPIELLHVEDDDQFAETMATYLEDAIGEFVVTRVPDGEAALDRLSATTVDCVVSDYRMPGMDGIELSRAVAERAPQLPFVLFTGRGSEAVAGEAVDAAVTSYLPKRADREGFERLAERVRDAVARAHTAVSYREVFDKAGVGLTVRDPETSRLLAVNDTYCETLGRDRETVLADGDAMLEPDGGEPASRTTGDTENRKNADEESAETNAEPASANDRPTPGGDDRTAAFREAVETGVGTTTWAARDADGEPLWLDVRYEVATIGGTERVLGSLRDATARRELSDRTEQVAALHDAATRIQRCETTDSVYEEVVAAAEEILEFDISVADELEGDTLYPRAMSAALSEDEYYETTPVDAEDNLAARACRTGEPSIVTDLTQRDATPADTEFRAALTVPIGDHGVFQAVSRAVGAFDESDLELTELLAAHAREALSRLERERELRARTRELRREKERSEVFASAVSHDLRNPLNVATGHLGMARRDRADDDHLAAVADALDRMEAITEDVLTIAREGATVESPEPVTLASLVEECWDNVDTTDATLQVLLPEGFTVGADPRRLRHVVENLFRNAMEHAGPRPTIELGALSEAEGFYVADDGPGIDPDSREEVFQPGYSTAANGTGFGLAIVGEMAGAHGWTVSATESADGGARFEFTGVDTGPTS